MACSDSPVTLLSSIETVEPHWPSAATTRASSAWSPRSASVLAFAVGEQLVLKLYPGAHHDSYQVEQSVLQAVHRRLPIPTSAVERTGHFEGWSYVLWFVCRASR
jgi:hypothetical protein